MTIEPTPGSWPVVPARAAERPALRAVRATRFLKALRTGASLPFLIEADDGARYVLKLRGAGQGQKALVAEIIAGELLRALGLPVPELALATLDPQHFGDPPDAAARRDLGDPEIRELIAASAGVNLASRLLPDAAGVDPLRLPELDAAFSSAVVWADALLMNVDRTPRNPNILLAAGRPALIDHGAALYIHHSWRDPATHSQGRFPQIREHVLLKAATRLAEADAVLAPRLSPDEVRALVGLVPDAFLRDEPGFAGPDALRAAYADYLIARLQAPRAFAAEAQAAHERLVARSGAPDDPADEKTSSAGNRRGVPDWLKGKP